MKKSSFLKRFFSLNMAVMLLMLAACGKPAENSSQTQDSEMSSAQSESEDAVSGDLSSADSSYEEASEPDESKPEPVKPDKDPSKPSEPSKPSKPSGPSNPSKPGNSSNNDSGMNEDADEEEIPLCEGYDYRKDPFYKKSTIYTTWVETWMGSSEPWFFKRSESLYNPKIKINGKYVSRDNSDPEHRKEVFKEAKEAGINAIITNLTEGHLGWMEQSKHYQEMCYKNGMKFACAIGTRPVDGKVPIDDICRDIWEIYAAPGMATYSSSYLYKDGKPVIVIYTWKSMFDQLNAAKGEYRDKFRFEYAEGETSNPNKWGWQLEPEDGPIMSKDSMWVTSSVKWGYYQPDIWRKSMAFLDFCFMAANEAKPKFVNVGSIDDETERNGWLKWDTSRAAYDGGMDIGDNTVPEIGHGLQMRDIYGNISETAYYNRVSDWVHGKAKPYKTGGPIADGAYTLTNAGNGKKFGADRPSETYGPYTDVDNVLKRDNYKSDMEQYYWFYYLGNGEYTVFKLSSGLSLNSRDGYLIQSYAKNSSKQRWTLKKAADGNYQIINKGDGKAICDANGTKKHITMVNADSKDASQLWSIKPVAERTF